jgi:peptidoglycan biosynthesis protein MviN/MurJ (putative lipid II flippase)
MLTIQMPEGHEKKRNRKRVRAVGYLVSGLIIIVTSLIALSSPWWYLVFVVEAWWLWAVITDPGLK